MSDLVPVAGEAPPSLPVSRPAPASRVTLPEATPSLEDLFLFSRDAELRFGALRMTIEEQVVTARGDERLQHEVWLRHPGRARVTTRGGGEMPSGDYEVWLLDGDTVTTYAATRKVASRRPCPRHVVGFDRPDLPVFARQREPLTALPAGSLVDTFVHPHGLFRHVLVSGPVAMVGRRDVGELEAIVVRVQHPRSAKVLVDRADRMIEVGISRETGLLLLLDEWVGDALTRHARVTQLLIDPVIPDSAFELRLPADVRMLY